MDFKLSALYAGTLVCCAFFAWGAPRGNAVTDAPGESTKLAAAAQKMPDHPLAPPEYRRPDGCVPHPYEKTLSQLRDACSDSMMAKAHAAYAHVEKTIADGKWKATPAGIDAHPCPAWFEDAKFGIFIDWGLWSLASWAPKKESGAMYPDWYELRMYSDFDEKSPFWGYRSYHVKNWGGDFQRDDFIPLFQAKRFNPEALVGTFKNAGAKYVAPFATQDVSYTRSKDGRFGYAIVKNLASEMTVAIASAENSDIVHLATGEKLPWKYADATKKSVVVSLGALADGDMPVALKIQLSSNR